MPLTPAPKGYFLRLLVTPNAKNDHIGPIVTLANGTRLLKVSITVLAQKGRANDSLIKFLAKTWHLPKSAFTLKQGMTNRYKTLYIENSSKTVATMLEIVAQKE